MNKTSDLGWFASSPNWIFLPHFSSFFLLFMFFVQKTSKKQVSTRVWHAQHPNTGQNIQHSIFESPLYSPSTIFDIYVFLTHSDCPAHKLFPSSVPVLTALLVGKSSRLLGMLHNFQVKTFQSTTHCCGQLIDTLKSMTSHKSAAHYYFLIWNY